MPNIPSEDWQSDWDARSPRHARASRPPCSCLGRERTCPGGVPCLSSYPDAGSYPAGPEACNHKQKGKATSGAGPRKGDEADGAAPSAQRISPPPTSRDVGGDAGASIPPVEMPVQTPLPAAGRGSGRVLAERQPASRPLPEPPRACGLTPPGPGAAGRQESRTAASRVHSLHGQGKAHVP